MKNQKAFRMFSRKFRRFCRRTLFFIAPDRRAVYLAKFQASRFNGGEMRVGSIEAYGRGCILRGCIVQSYNVEMSPIYDAIIYVNRKIDSRQDWIRVFYSPQPEEMLRGFCGRNKYKTVPAAYLRVVV